MRRARRWTTGALAVIALALSVASACARANPATAPVEVATDFPIVVDGGSLQVPYFGLALDHVPPGWEPSRSWEPTSVGEDMVSLESTWWPINDVESHDTFAVCVGRTERSSCLTEGPELVSLLKAPNGVSVSISVHPRSPRIDNDKDARVWGLVSTQ